MSRCRHRNATLFVQESCAREHLFDGGEILAGCSFTDNYVRTGRVRVLCNDCGMDRVYPTERSYPKWLRSMMEQAFEKGAQIH